MSVNIKVTGGLNIEWGQIDPKVTGGLNDTEFVNGWPFFYFLCSPSMFLWICFCVHSLLSAIMAIILSPLLVRRARVVRRSTRWTSAASRPPSRSCSSTGIQTPQDQWSSPCRPPTTSVQCRLRRAPPPACRGSLSPRRCTPPPPTAARTLSAATTRWCCQNLMKCWLQRPPLPMCRWVRSTETCFSWMRTERVERIPPV